MKILLTGANGLFGSEFALISSKNLHEIYSGYYKGLPANGIAKQIDITDMKQVEKVFNETNPDVVIHAASLTDVDKCETNKDLAWNTNVIGTKNVVNLANSADIYTLYISTDYVFDGERGNYSENDNPKPINYYGFTKLEAEKIVSALKKWSIIRTSVIFGAKPASGKVNFALWLISKLKRLQSVNVVTDQYVSPTLNTNLAEMTLEIIERKLTGFFHLSGATRISRFNFALELAKIFGFNTNQIHPTLSEKMRWIAKRPFDSSLNTSKAQRILKHKPETTRVSLGHLQSQLVRAD